MYEINFKKQVTISINNTKNKNMNKKITGNKVSKIDKIKNI